MMVVVVAVVVVVVFEYIPLVGHYGLDHPRYDR